MPFALKMLFLKSAEDKHTDICIELDICTYVCMVQGGPIEHEP